MAIPTQFSVTNKRSAPLANPDQSIDNPNPLSAEDVGFISGASALPVKSAGDIDSPNEISAQPVSGIDNASLFSALSVGTINNPSIVTAEPVEPIGNASLLSVQSQPTLPAPSVATAESQAALPAPSVATAESQAALPIPSALTPNSGTPTTPPFPLNHARILYQNILSNYSSTSASEGDSNTVYLSLLPNTWQRFTFSTTGRYTVDLSFRQGCDTICIGSHNLSDGGYTVQAFIKELPADPFISFSPSVTPTTNAPIMFHIGSTINVSSVQIRITGGTGGGYVGYTSAGIALQMQRPFFNGHTPITDGDVTDYYSNRTESGEIIGQQIRRKGFETSADWQNIDDTWYRAYFAPFKQSAKSRPFFFAWNLLEYPEDVGFCRISQDISAPMQNGTRTKRSISMNLLGAG